MRYRQGVTAPTDIRAEVGKINLGNKRCMTSRSRSPQGDYEKHRGARRAQAYGGVELIGRRRRNGGTRLRRPRDHIMVPVDAEGEEPGQRPIHSPRQVEIRNVLGVRGAVQNIRVERPDLI